MPFLMSALASWASLAAWPGQWHQLALGGRGREGMHGAGAGGDALPSAGPCGPHPTSVSITVPGAVGPPWALCQGRAQGDRVP